MFTDPRNDKDVTTQPGGIFPGHVHGHDESEGSEFLDESLRMTEQPLEEDSIDQ
jgi:hypothetical protein